MFFLYIIEWLVLKVFLLKINYNSLPLIRLNSYRFSLTLLKIFSHLLQISCFFQNFEYLLDHLLSREAFNCKESELIDFWLENPSRPINSFQRRSKFAPANFRPILFTEFSFYSMDSL